MILVGEAIESGDVRAISLGGSTQLFVDSLGAVHLNPALLARIPRVTIGATQYLAVDQGRSDTYNERDASFTFSSFRIVFPITGLFRFAVGYTGRYEPDGGFSLRDATEGGDRFTQTFKKSGGLFSVPLTASFDVKRFASVGLTFSLERGTVQERWDIVFDEGGSTPGAGLKKEDLSGTGFGGGVVFYPANGLMIGGMVESAVDYDAEVFEKYTQTSLDTSYSSTLSLPGRVSAGASWRWGDRFMFLASAAWRDFAGFEGMGFPERGAGLPPSRLRSEQSYSFGVEYLRGLRLRSKRIPLRIGFNYQQLPLEFPAGQPVNKYLVSLGTGIGIRGGRGKVDIAVVAGKDGSIGSNGIENRLFRIYLGVSGSEAWKRKGEEQY
jgi:long-subunit fatty acid transport protein